MKAIMNKLAYVAIAMIGFAGLVWAQEQVGSPAGGTVISEDTTVFAFGNYVKLNVPGVDHTRYEITTNGVPMTSGGKTDGEFYVPADAVPVKVTYTPAPTFQFTEPTKTEWEYGSEDTKEDEITLSKDEVLAGIGNIASGAPVEYFVWDEAQKQLVAQTCTVYEVVTAETTTLQGGWYVVNDDVVIDRGEDLWPGLMVKGDVHLILCDGESLVMTGGVECAGIEVTADYSLSIYGQAGQTGVLTATGSSSIGAGIGCVRRVTVGRVTIHGGMVNACGGGAGIGGNGGFVTINGGIVTANGGSGSGSVGLGGGGFYKDTEPATVTINGGLVIANGGGKYAGIGFGRNGTGGTVTIAGGTVVANGGAGAAGIGGGGENGAACDVTIIAGDVTAVGGEGGEGIGKGAGAAASAYGTFALGPFTEATILAGMDPTGTDAQRVEPEDFADQGATTGWHAQRYVHVTAVKLPAPGSPEKPWDVSTNGSGQPQAVTNGNNEVIVTGEGLPKPYGENDPAPWADAVPEIEKIYVPQGTEDIYKKQWPDDKVKIVALPDYLSFTAKDGDVYISYCKTYDGVYGLEYSFDPIAEDWSELKEITATYDDIAYGSTVEGDKVLVPNGQTLYVRKAGNEVKFSMCDSDQRARFSMSRVDANGTATVEAGGNVMSLLDQTCRSKEVGDYAFSMLFGYCSILTTAPKLPATKLDSGCYENMFYNCTALEVAPELPVTQLSSGCYRQMFAGCSALKKAPELPARELAHGCYGNMFFGCGQLNYIKVGFDVWPTDPYCENWLEYVASEGTFVCSQALENDFAAKGLSYGGSTIPAGWRVARDYLSFTAKGGNITLTLGEVGSPPAFAFEYSFNAGADAWTTYTEPIQITKDQTVYFRKQGEAVKAISSTVGQRTFSFGGDEGATVAAGGNVMSMLDPTCQSRKIGDHGIRDLFTDCTRLVSAPRIEADTIGGFGCSAMFYGCMSLTTAPVIGGGEISSEYGISSMFMGSGLLNEITVGFTEWIGTVGWVANVAPFGVFRCPSELPIIVDTSHIPVGWIVFKKFSIPVIEGLEHSVTNLLTGEEIAPIAVSQDGTKTYEVPAGGEDKFGVFFEDIDGFPVAGEDMFDFGNLSDSIEIDSEKYPLPERGVLLTVGGAPAHSSFTIYCDGEVFAEGGAADLTTRVSSNVMTKVVYKTDEGWAYAFEGGQPVTEKEQLNKQVTATTEVSAPDVQPDNYQKVWDEAGKFNEDASEQIGQLGSKYQLAVVSTLLTEKQDEIKDFVDLIKENPLPSSEKLAALESANAAFDEWLVKIVDEADKFDTALKSAEAKLKAAADELKALEPTKYYDDEGTAIIANTTKQIGDIKANRTPPIADRSADLAAAVKSFDAAFATLKAEIEAFKQAKQNAQTKLSTLKTKYDGLMDDPAIAAQWAKMNASKDPSVAAKIAAITGTKEKLRNDLTSAQATLTAAQKMSDVDNVTQQTDAADKVYEDIYKTISEYQIPQYLLRVPVSVANSDKMNYSVYTGETAQVTIVADANVTNEYRYVYETPVKVVYKLTADGWAFDAAEHKEVTELVALEDMMKGDRLLAEPALGNLKDLDGVYNGAKDQFAVWAKDAGEMPGDLGGQIKEYIVDAQAAVDGLYAIGVPVSEQCDKIDEQVSNTEGKIEPLFKQGYQQLAQERGNELQQKYDQFLGENDERISEIGTYGTPEAQKLLQEVAQLKKDCDDLLKKVETGTVDNKPDYQVLLDGKKKLEEQMENLAKQLKEAIRFVTALPISAEQDLYGSVIVRSTQGLISGEQSWIVLWFSKDVENGAIGNAEQFIGRKFHDVPAEELYQYYSKSDYNKKDYDSSSLGDLYPPADNLTACVIAAIDNQGAISRVGGVGGLGALKPGEVKGADITGSAAMQISYYMSKEGDGELFLQTAMALPLTSRDEVVVLDAEKSGYYAVLGDCEIASLTVKGDVTLILGRGCDLSVLDGIVLAQSTTLRICSEHDFRYNPHLTGRMSVEKTYVDANKAAFYGPPKSALEIHGGVIDITSAAAGICVGRFIMYNGDVTVTGGEGYAGVNQRDEKNQQCRVEAGKLNVIGGAGAAAIGGNVGQVGGNVSVIGGLVRADATPTEDGKCGASIGAGAGSIKHGIFVLGNNLSIFTAENATSKMNITTASIYAKMRHPSVLITPGANLIQPLPFTLTKENEYKLLMPGYPQYHYGYIALTKDDLARAYGEGSTVGAEIWKTVSQIATGARVAVGEMTCESFLRSLCQMGINPKNIGYGHFSGDVGVVNHNASVAMIVTFDCNEQDQIVRLGGINVPESMTDGSSIESPIGHEAISELAFQAVAKNGAIVLQNKSGVSSQNIAVYCYTKSSIADTWGSDAALAAAVTEKIGREVGTVSAYEFLYGCSAVLDMSSFGQGEYAVVVAMTYDTNKQVMRIGVVTGLETMTDGQSKDNAALIGAQSFTVRAENQDQALLLMPEVPPQGHAWLWVRVCDETKYEALDTFINGLIGQPIGAEGTMLKPLDLAAMPATFGTGNWGLFTGDSVLISRRDAKTDDPMRGVVVFKVSTLSTGETGSEMPVLAAGGVKNVDKLADGKELSNQYGEDVERIVNQPFSVTRMDEDGQPLEVAPQDALMEGERWCYLALDEKASEGMVASFSRALIGYLGAAVGDLKYGTLRDMGYDIQETTESPFRVSGDTEAVFLFKIDALSNVLSIGLAEGLSQLYEPGMSKSDTFGKTFIAAQDFGVTRAGDVLTASVYEQDAYGAGLARDRFICFTYADATVAADVIGQLPAILGTTEVGACTLSSLGGGVEPTLLGTFTTDELSLELPADCSNVFVARVHGVHDAIVTIGALNALDTIADGETRQPGEDAGFQRIRPFNFTVTRAEDGTFTLTGDERQPNEEWLWLAVPPHVRYVMEQKFESSERLLELMRCEMVEMSVENGGSTRKSRALNPEQLQILLGEGYYGTSLDTQLNVEQIPTDTEVLLVFKTDRATGRLYAEGGAIDLDQLTTGQQKQNQVNGKVSYVEVDGVGNRTQKEATVEPITGLTTTIGGGRWYVITDLQKYAMSSDVFKRLTVEGEANIILCDNNIGNRHHDIVLNGGFAVNAGATLNIYGQQMGNGILQVTGADGCAAIGGDEGCGCGTISIHGGFVVAEAGVGAAAIGGGYMNGIENGKVMFFGGIVAAVALEAASIGGGQYGCGCNVGIGAAATIICTSFGDEETTGIGGCDGLENGVVAIVGENRVYLEADEAFTPHSRDYYFGDVRRGNFITTELLTISVPKDERFQYNVSSLTLGDDFGGVLPGDDAYTYKVLRGDTVVVTAATDKHAAITYGFRGPNVFKFDCVQADVTISADDLKVAPMRFVKAMDFTVTHDHSGKVALKVNEAFAPGELLVWAAIPEGMKPPSPNQSIKMLFESPASLLSMLLIEGLPVGKQCCDQFAMLVGAKNWNIEFDYAGEEILLPANTRHVLAFKVYDAGRYASLAESGGGGRYYAQQDGQSVDGRLALIKVGAVENIPQRQYDTPIPNQVDGLVSLIKRQPFALTRNMDGTFRLVLNGTLNANNGEKWGFATLNSASIAMLGMIEEGMTVEDFLNTFDSLIGGPIGTLELEDLLEMGPLFSKVGTSDSNIFECPNDTEVVLAFKSCQTKDGDCICTFGYAVSDLQAMTPGGTERKGNEIDGEVDAPSYFVTVANIPEGVKLEVSYSLGKSGNWFEPEVKGGSVLFAVQEGTDVEIEFKAPDGYIFRTKNSVSIDAIHQDELVDASYLILTERGLIRAQDFTLRRNPDKTFALEMPEGALDIEKGDRWFYLALNAQDASLTIGGDAPAGVMLWMQANDMIGREVGSSEELTTMYFTSAMRDGYCGYTTERFADLPADTEMLIVCKCFNVTEEDGFSVTYVETVGGSQNLQRTGDEEVRNNEVDDYADGPYATVHYQKWDTGKSAFVPGGTVWAKVLTDDTTTIGNDQWYVVPFMEEVSCDTITIQGTANVIIGDVGQLDLEKFVVGEGATLNVYGQSVRFGVLNVVGDGHGVAIGSETVCGTINLHGVIVVIDGDDVGIGGMAVGGELNVLGANVMVMAEGSAIAGCTVNAYGGRVLAASMSDGDYPAINDGLAIKNGKMGLFAGSEDPTALQPTKVADYLANRQPFAKIVEQVNIVLPKVEHVTAMAASVDFSSGGSPVFINGEELGDWIVFRAERFDNVMVHLEAEEGYQLRSPADYCFMSIDSDKQLPVDAVVVVPQTMPPQMIVRQPFSIIRTTDENGPYCELKPIGELGPGERWFWMSCDKTLAQTTGTIPDFEDTTTEAAVIAMLNQAIGHAPVGYLSLDEYYLRAQLPINQSGVGTSETFRLPADTDLVLLSKVYDGGLLDNGMVRYFNITLGLSTNLTEKLEQGGDSGHNDVGEEPTEEEVKNALEEAFPEPHEVTQEEDGSFRITLMEDMTGPVAIPDNLGEIVLDMNGFHIIGTNGVNGADGGNALVFTDSGDVGPTTELTIVEANEKYNEEPDVVGGNGADGQVPGKGGAAIRVDTKRGVTINVEGTVLVVGGKGGTLLNGEPGFKPGTPGPGIDPQDTRGDRAPESVQPGKTGEDLKPWAKAKLRSNRSADEIAPQLPEGVTVVGSELWFWKRAGEDGEMIGFDFRTIQLIWLADYTIRFAAGTYLVDQFIYENDRMLTFVGADSAAVATEGRYGTTEFIPSKKTTMVGMHLEIPEVGKYTVLVSTGKSIFKATEELLLMAIGPLGKTAGFVTWSNLGFTAVTGTAIEGNGGAINAANVDDLMVADCEFVGLTAGQLGGAIYAAGLRQGGLITNTTFTACSVDSASGLGGAIYVTGGKAPFQAAGPLGAKYTTRPLTIVDSVFELNDAQSGGAIFSSPTYDHEKAIELVISGSTFNGNTAHYNGGAICAVGKVTIADAAAGEGTFFAYNEAGVYGGALAIDGVEDAVAGSEVSVGSNTVFACNKVENDWAVEALGGAIMLQTNCMLTVRNALFTNNVAVCSCEALDAYGAYGGAISTADGCLKYIEKTAFIDNAAIVENATSGNRYAAGGALSECGGVTLIDTCVFDGNTVVGEIPVGGALDLEFDEEATVLNSTFRNSNWEAVSVYDASAVIRNCVIVGNSVSEEWYDLYLDVGEVELTFSAYGELFKAETTEVVSSNNLAGVTADQVYDGETLQLATNVYNAVAALGYPQPGVTDFNGVEYGSTFWGTSMGAFETPAIYPVEQLGFEITVDPLELAWTGMKVHPTSVAVTNPLTRAELTEGVDYTVAFENDTEASDQARVVVTGIGDYSGVATTNYWITSYLVRYYLCDEDDTPLEQVQLGSLAGSNVVAKIAPPAGYAFDPFHEGTVTNGTVSLYDSTVDDIFGGRLVLNVFYAKSSGGDDDVPDKYQRKITYKVVNGWWDDLGNGLDQAVWVTLFDEDGKWSENGTGALPGVPTVGQTPFAGYAKAGVWYPEQPSTVEMPITRSSPAQPFFLYVYCPQPEGGAGRAGRGGTGTVTEADLNALKSHLQTRFNITDFSAIGPHITGGIVVGVVDDATGNLLASEPLEGAKVNVKSTTDLASGEWASSEVPTDGKGQFSIPKPEGVDQFFIQVEPAGK